jgi:hypothetical protein
MTRKDFLKKCESLGVVYEKGDFAHSIDAPSGFVFASIGVHYADFVSDGTFTMPEIYDELNEYLKDGIVKCTDENCEICRS